VEGPVKSLTVTLASPIHLLVLIGGGEFSFGETRTIDEYLLQNIPADRRTIAFLPTASGSAEYASHIGTYFKSIAPDVTTTNVPVYRGRDSRRQRNLNDIIAAGLVYLGGGVTNNVLDTIRETPTDLAMRDAASRGALIAAIGASASCFGVSARDMRTGGALPGLGWLAGTVIDTGFDAEDDSSLRRLMSVPEVRLGLGIPAGTALVIRADGSTEILGGGSIAVFRKA
jgi:cyanophycinase-like exopeptidase